MVPFRVTFRAGVSLFEQVVYASIKAIVSGQLRPGDAFPSVRALSKELKINPNTAHKIVAHLVNEGLLETRPGIGTVVAAKRLGIELAEMLESISAHWEHLSGEAPPSAQNAAQTVDGGDEGR